MTLTPENAGDAVAHAGRTRHAGAATTEGERARPRLFFGVDGTGPRTVVPGAGHGFAACRQVRAGRARREVGASDGRGRRGGAAQNRRSVVARARRRVCATKATVGRGAGRRRGGAPLGSRSPGALRRRRAAWRRVAGARARFVGEDFRAAAEPCRAALRAARTDVERAYPAHDLALADTEAERLSVAVARWRLGDTRGDWLASVYYAPSRG